MESLRTTDPLIASLKERINLCKNNFKDFDYDSLTDDEKYLLIDVNNPCRVDCVLHRFPTVSFSVYFTDGKTNCGPNRVCIAGPQHSYAICQTLKLNGTTVSTSKQTTAHFNSTITSFESSPKRQTTVRIYPTNSPSTLSPSLHSTSPMTPSPTTPTTPSPTTPSTPSPTTPTTPSPTTPSTPSPTTPTTPSPTTPTTPSPTTPSTPSTTTPTTPSPTLPSTSSPSRLTSKVTTITTITPITITTSTKMKMCRSSGFFRDPTDPECHRFYRCVSIGDTYERQDLICINGTKFDESINSCQFPNLLKQLCPRK